TRFSRDWSSDVCSSDLEQELLAREAVLGGLHRQEHPRPESGPQGTEGQDSAYLAILAELRGGELKGTLRRHVLGTALHVLDEPEIGRASCRERGEIWVG